MLPAVPGVYIFKDRNQNLLYVGKANKLRERVSSYFQPPTRLGPKTTALVGQIKSIEYIEVGSEIEALLLESKLINRFKPPYNIASKDDKSPYYIHLTKELFPRPTINHEPSTAFAGPFLSGWVARKILGYFRRIAPFCTASRPVRRPCLYSHLGLCNPCPGDPKTDRQIYLKNISRLKNLLQGKFSHVLTGLKKQMQVSSKDQDFEAAAELRDKISHLEQLLHAPVLPEEYLANPNLVDDKRREALDALYKALTTSPLNPLLNSGGENEGGGVLHRIEMYDIANLSGTAPTGAMTVAINGQANSKFYRHFTIKTKSTPDDVTMMREMLQRRLKNTDWPKPDLIVLDGGMPQLSIFTNKVSPLNVRGVAAGGGDIPVVALAKQEEIIFKPTGEQIKLDRDNPGLKLLQVLRDEAHRFSRRLHHKHRSQVLK
jgi:excinuclease ABC subunit C